MLCEQKEATLTVAPPIARATLAPTPTMHRVRICVPYDGAYAEPMLAPMAMSVKIRYAGRRPYKLTKGVTTNGVTPPKSVYVVVR